MAASLIGNDIHVCNCGPSCKCGHSSAEASSCPCDKPTVPRRVLAEDARHVYVSQTGADVEGSETLGEAPFTCGNGRPMQRFPITESLRERAEALAPSGPGGPPGASPGTTARQGTHMGVSWSFQPSSDRMATLTIGDRQLHLYADAQNGWRTHAMEGRWTDVATLAQNIIRFHPDYSPLARPRIA